MIYGIGIDIVSYEKVKKICNSNKSLLKDNLFTSRELYDAGVDDSYAQLTDDQIRILSSKFAAKEAAVKAIGIPFDISFDWSDVVVSGGEDISVEMLGNIKEYIQEIGILNLNGSVSSSNSHSIAIIIGELK